MISVNSIQQSILDADHKIVSWLFTVNGGSYYLSTKEYTYGGNDFDNRIIPKSFKGLEFNSGMSQAGIQAPNRFSFDISNPGNTLASSYFQDQTFKVECVGNDYANEAALGTWKFRCLHCNPVQEKSKVMCEDFLQQYLEGDYPNKPLLTHLAPSTDETPDDTMCVPVVFGTAYIPARSVYITDQRYYFLGESGPTYTVDEVQAPLEGGFHKSIWQSNSYSFNVSSKTLDGVSYQVFQAIIADSDGDGTPDANGLFYSGDRFWDMPTKFSHTTTNSMTNPADIIEYVLEDMGVPSADIDTGGGSSFETAGSTYDTWGLQWNGGFYYRMPREKALSMLLNMCHSTLRITDKVELYVLVNSSQMTLTTAHIAKTGKIGPTTFNYSSIRKSPEDSGDIAFCKSGDPQSKLQRATVPAKSNTDHPTGGILELPMVTDSVEAQKLGILDLQRKVGKKAKGGFKARDDCMVIQPDDVVSLNGDFYGGNYDVLIEGITIRRNLMVDLKYVRFEHALDDWEDLAPGSITPATDDSTNMYVPLIVGPDGEVTSGSKPNVVRGKFRVGETGDYVLTDPSIPGLELYENGNLKMTFGKVSSDYGLITDNYVSGFAGAGLLLTEDWLEVGNIAARGIIRTAVFQKDIVSAIGGNLMVTMGSDVLSTDMTAADASTLTIEGNETFAVGDFLRIKDGTDDEWLEVTNIASAPTYTVTRDKDSQYGVDDNPAWKKGATVVNYGQSGDGGVLITASETNAPHVLVFTHAGSPWDTITTQLRVGNLNGYLGYSSDIYGFGAGDTSSFVKINPTDGIVLGGNSLNAAISIGSATWGEAGIQAQYNSGTPRLNVGDGANAYWQFDGTKVIWKAANSELDTDGKLICTGATISGLVEIIGDQSLQNMLSNGGFEEGDVYWAIRTGTVSFETSGGDNSNNYIKITSPSGSAYYAFITDIADAYKYFEVNANEAYEWGGSLKQSGGCTAYIYLKWHDKDKTYIGQESVNSTSTTWETKTSSYVMPATAKFVTLFVYGASMTTGDTVCFDNVYLKRIDEKAWSWTHGSDRTAIDGGNLYVGSNINLGPGGDIDLDPSDTDPALLRWDTDYYLGAGATAANGLCFYPGTAGSGYFHVGRKWDGSAHVFHQAEIRADNGIYLLEYTDANNYNYLYLDTSCMLITREGGGTAITVKLDGSDGAFMPSVNKGIDCAIPGTAWDDCCADDFPNEGDFFMMGHKKDRETGIITEFSDLEIIAGIQGTGNYGGKNKGLFEVTDDSTIPDWIKRVQKEDKVFKDPETGEVLYTQKKGDIALSPEGKPYLSLKTMISLCMGAAKENMEAIKELDAKVEAHINE